MRRSKDLQISEVFEDTLRFEEYEKNIIISMLVLVLVILMSYFNYFMIKTSMLNMEFKPLIILA